MKLTRREWTLALAAGAACSRTREEPRAAGERHGSAAAPHVIDLHCDTPMRILADGFDLSSRNEYGQVDIPRMREGGVTGVFFAVYCPAARGRTPEKVTEALEIVEGIRREVERSPEDLAMASGSGGIERARREGKIAIVLGVEGGHMIDSSLENLRKLHGLGGLYLTLTHTRHTPWAGSSGDTPEGDPGLTSQGREIVAEMNSLGMMVDVSHISDKTFWGVMEESKAPVIASHSSCRAICNHPRNMTDQMLRRLADRGGAIHINYYNAFLDEDYRQRAAAAPSIEPLLAAARARHADDPKARALAEWEIRMKRLEEIGRVPFDRLLDHFAHAIDVAGVEHVGLGSDFDGVNEELPEGMEDISKIPNLTAGLERRGVRADDIEKVLGGNTLRVMRDVENSARPHAV